MSTSLLRSHRQRQTRARGALRAALVRVYSHPGIGAPLDGSLREAVRLFAWSLLDAARNQHWNEVHPLTRVGDDAQALLAAQAQAGQTLLHPVHVAALVAEAWRESQRHRRPADGSDLV
jgi:hypothetical protein